MEWLIAPFEVSFVARALWGGLLVSCLCAIAGTWVVVRGMAFLADAMAHGMLPGIAVAALLGGNLLVGAAFSAGAMALGVTALSRDTRFSADIGIGLLFVGMLSVGVVIVSRAQSFAVDLTGFLFGDVLAIRDRDLFWLVVALLAAAVTAAAGHRAFLAASFDERTAHTLGLRPKLAHAAMVGLITLAIVASFHIVGTLLVFGLLIAPPAAAMLWVHRIPLIMLTAAGLGSAATFVGLLVSWHVGTAAGATIAATAVGFFFLSAAASALRARIRFGGRGTRVGAAAVVAAVSVAGCGATGPVDDDAEPTPHGYVAGAEETAEPNPRLVLVDKDSGAVRVLDLLSQEVTELDTVPGADRIATDRRHVYVSGERGVTVVDSGSWLVDHGDHVHYYRAPIRAVGAHESGDVVAAASDSTVAALSSPDGGATLLDRAALDNGEVREIGWRADGPAVPLGERVLVADPATGAVTVRTREGAVESTLDAPCAEARGTAVTRRGVVFGCADGALVVSADGGAFAGEKIAYPAPVPPAERAVAFTHRPNSATLAAAAGDRGVWELDIRKKTWSFVPTGAVVAANTPGEGAALLALTPDGVLRAYDVENGTEVKSAPLVTPGASATIAIDTSRVYVNDPVARKVFEIDHADLRVARTFDLDISPGLLAETGE
ncbi:metal ABC transporter permease [Nocardia puris]|uniref:zinc ABC transporter permease AztB n=1 Tax=Nocardia puris TaxID=208602 RepID=UPI001892E7C3|nr:zinc ABC transporter permease AztB [Nocardia puris]MBF6210279.1 metal ABC transporter permease [Nocardia puris]MBF6367355.1 metal ABC transporter permease [Nocardia puris]MBF6457540.1 metal ABC transporter permease [Nocardia puris]